MAKAKPRIVIKKEWCKGCAICVEFCPKDVFRMEGDYPIVVDIDACTQCELCEIMCPDFAILLEKTKSKKKSTKSKVRSTKK